MVPISEVVIPIVHGEATRTLTTIRYGRRAVGSGVVAATPISLTALHFLALY
jgi:hypothetical protein